MTPRERLIQAIRDEGWVCEFHEPDPDCAMCYRLHAKTLDAVLDELRVLHREGVDLMAETREWLEPLREGE